MYSIFVRYVSERKLYILFYLLNLVVSYIGIKTLTCNIDLFDFINSKYSYNNRVERYRKSIRCY